MSNDEAQGLDKIFPLHKGDNFRVGPDHFVCMGWQDGRIRAMTHRPHQGFFMYSFLPEVLLSPMFKMLHKADEVKT